MIDVGSYAASLILFAMFGGPPQVGPGQTDVGFMWFRLPNGTCGRLDTSKLNQLPKLETWIDGYDYAEMSRQYFVKQGWIVYNTDPASPMCNTAKNASTQGLYGVPVPPVVTPPPVVPTPTVTTVSAPAGTLTDAAGGIWTFGAATSAGGNVLVLNGTPTSGFGKTLQLTNGNVYTFTADGKWFVWNGAWTATVAP